MIELIAYEQKPTLATDVVGDQWTLDIAQPGGISLKYEVSKGNDILGRYSPFSQTFRLPFTNYNSRFFGLYYDVNLTQSNAGNVFNIHKKSYCEIRVDGVPIITGSLQLKNVHTKTEEYEVAVFGEEASIFQEIKDRKLIDLFISESTGAMDVDYDVPLSPADIVNSWTLTNDVTQGNVGNGVIVFPLADYGLGGESSFLYYDDGNLEAQGIAQENFLQPYMFKPAINVAHLFEKIFTQAGYTLKTNTFLTSDAWTKLYMTLATDRESVAIRPVAGLCVSHTPATSIAQVNWAAAPNPQESAGAYEIVDLALDDDTGVGVNSNPPALFDESNNWKYFASIDEGYFDAPDTGMYYGTTNLGYETNLTDVGRIAMRVQRLSGNQDTGSYYFPGPYTDVSGVSSGFLPTHEWAMFLEAGDRLYYQAEIIIYSANQSGDYIRVIPEGTFFTVYASNLNNGIAQMPNNMPDVQQSVFVKDLAERFNLCITSDNNDVKQLNIQPWQDYIDAGDRKDWTDKLDTSKEFTIKPTDTIRNKFLHFEDAEDDTIFNSNFQEQNEYVIGRYKQEVGEDFTSGTLKNNP